MAVNESRSMNRDLREGLTDGVVKKAAPDRGGDVEYTVGSPYGLLPSLQGRFDMVTSDRAKDEMALRQTSLS